MYYAFLVVVLIVAPALFPRSSLVHDAGKDQAWVWLYATNFRIALENRWAFCGMAVCGQGIELNHTWSLAVEEHFYLAWPVVVLLCSRRMLLHTCAALILAALVFRLLLRDHWFAMYALTPCRMDALVLGAFLATAIREHGLAWLRRFGAVPAALAAVTFAAIVALPGGPLARPPAVQALSFTLTAILSAALIVIALMSSVAPSHPGLVARVLGNRGRLWANTVMDCISFIRPCARSSYGCFLRTAWRRGWDLLPLRSSPRHRCILSARVL